MICLTPRFRWEADLGYLWWSSWRTQGFAGPEMEGSFGWKQQRSTQMHLVVSVVRVSYISTQVGFLRPDVFTDLWLHGGVDRRWNNAFFSQRNLTFTLHDVWGWRNPFFSARCELPLFNLCHSEAMWIRVILSTFRMKNPYEKSMPASFFMPNFGMSWSGMGRFIGQSHGSVDTWARSTEGCTRCETKTFWWKEKKWQSLTEWQFLFNKKTGFSENMFSLWANFHSTSHRQEQTRTRTTHIAIIACLITCTSGKGSVFAPATYARSYEGNTCRRCSGANCPIEVRAPLLYTSKGVYVSLFARHQNSTHRYATSSL